MRITLPVRKNLLLVLFALIMLALAGCGGSSYEFQSPIKPAPPPPQPILRNQNLINGIIAVKPGSHYHQHFTVTGNMANATVTGSFNASAGLGDNIEVYILNDLAYTNWSAGSASPSGFFYKSGRIKTDNLNVPLGSGSYHLVLNNRYSTFSTKQVTTDIELRWYE